MPTVPLYSQASSSGSYDDQDEPEHHPDHRRSSVTNSSDDQHPMTTLVASGEVTRPTTDKDHERDRHAVRCVRLLVFGLLLFSALLMGGLAYWWTRRSEHKQWRVSVSIYINVFACILYLDGCKGEREERESPTNP